MRSMKSLAPYERNVLKSDDIDVLEECMRDYSKQEELS